MVNEAVPGVFDELMSRSVFDEQDKVKALKGLVSALPREGDARTPAPPRYGQGGFCRDVPECSGASKNGRGEGNLGQRLDTGD